MRLFQFTFWCFFAASVVGAYEMSAVLHQPIAAVSLLLVAVGCALGAFASGGK